MRATRWFGMAAARGHAEAQLYLGVMYEQGTGVARDLVRAQVFYILAAAAGEQEAARNRDFNARNLSPAQQAEAERLAAEWKAKQDG